MMSRLTSIIILLSMLASCTANYLITVRQDGSASVNTDRDYDLTNINRYYRSDVISNIDTNVNLGGRVTFEISNIDSMGHYLPLHPQGFFQFKLDSNALTITDGHTAAFREDVWYCCAIGMKISFDQKIKEVKSIKGNAKKTSNNSVFIHKSRRQLLKGKKRTELIIKL